MSLLHINLLGPLRATLDDTPIQFRTDAQRVLLAYLAAHQGTPQRRDTLAALLSSERNNADALTYLRNRLTRLRQALRDDKAASPWLEVDRKQIALRTGGDIAIDLVDFEQHLAAVEGHAHRELAGCPTCLARLQAAVNLVRGEFLVGLNFPSETWEAWLLGQREYVQQRALDAMTALRAARLARGDWSAALAVAQRQLVLEPWLEAAHRAAMFAHERLGERNAALAQYAQCEQILQEELGIEPEEETRELRQQIVDGALAEPEKVGVADNLPLQTIRFFGRDAEQAQLLEQLVDPAHRLITLVGTGGMGKTRLAIEVGRQVKASFPDGVWLVALDAVKGEPGQLAEQIKIAVGEAAGLAQAGKQLTGDQVLAILRDKRMLLILDNCEPLLDELLFLSTWLQRAPGIAVLATSREPLNLAAESVVGLVGLEIGEQRLEIGDRGMANGEWRTVNGEWVLGPAEALFAERAQTARADFALSLANLPQVRQICERVDGLPLAIALAAAWVRRRSLAQIADAIGESLDFLSTRLRDVDPRHRSMKAVFETSWQLLDAEEQAVLAMLSIFPASFSTEAAQQVAGARLDTLDLLCEKSLLQQQVERERYAMHPLVRQFAAEKLAGATSAEARLPKRVLNIGLAFVDYFGHLAYKQRENHAALQPEWRNFSAAIAEARALSAWQTVIDFVEVLDEPWFRQARFQEMRAGLWLAVEAAAALGDERALAQMLLRLGEIEIELNKYDASSGHLVDALDRFMNLEDGPGIAHARYLFGRIHVERGQDNEALDQFAQSKQVFEAEHNSLGLARNWTMIAFCLLRKQKDIEAAHDMLERAVSLLRQLPLSSALVEALRYLARAKYNLGMFEAAERRLAEATGVSRACQDVGEYAAVLFERTVLYRRQNQPAQALRCGTECLASFQKLGLLRGEALIKMQLAMLHQGEGNLSHALTLFRDSLRLFVEQDDLYEQAYAHYFLFKLYAEMGRAEPSAKAKEQAIALNSVLQDPELSTRLA